MITRRSFNIGMTVVGGVAAAQKALPFKLSGAELPLWQPGELDIHQIDTGRGNAAFLIGPDGTTILIDCGATNDSLDVSAPCRPNASHRPGEWVARYALHHAQAARRKTLDFLIATHIHPDHVGDIPLGMTPSNGSTFVPTGVSQFDLLMPVTCAIDRGYPDYGSLAPPHAPFAANYLAWLHARRKSGRKVERAIIGSDSQITLRSPDQYPTFSIRVVAGNGQVWTGRDRESYSIFPDLGSLLKDDWPNENVYSVAIKLSYGGFSYYSGGDLTSETEDGRLPWMDVESAVARSVGQVEVAVANHHGYFDACGPEFVRQLNPQAFVIPAWHLTHPGPAQIERMLGAWPGVKKHDAFTSEMLPANRLFNSRWVNQLRSLQGHIVTRVASSGNSYRIFVLDSNRVDGPILSAFGPYFSRV